MSEAALSPSNPGAAERRRLRARELELEERHEEALEELAEAANAGDPPAMAILGARLMLGQRCPLDPLTGYGLILDAAAQGHGEACEMAAALVATGIGRDPDYRQALVWLQRAAELGEPRARRQLAVLTSDPTLAERIRAGDPAPELWRRAAGTVQPSAWITPPPASLHSQAPMIMTFQNFLPKSACDWLIERARGAIVPARVYDNQRGGLKQDDRRSNGVALFRPPLFDVVIALIRARIAAAARMPLPALEAFSVLHYEPGQRFTRHHDFMDPQVPGQAASLKAQGQRVATFLAYLNDDYEGGETRFPMLDWSYRGRAGDALLFINIDRSGAPERRTLHEGVATRSGRKWLLSQFIRNQPQPYDDGAPPVEG